MRKLPRSKDKEGFSAQSGGSEDGGMTAHDRPERRLGSLLVLASAVPFALSGVFTRLITADVWTVLCWRGLIGAWIVVA